MITFEEKSKFETFFSAYQKYLKYSDGYLKNIAHKIIHYEQFLLRSLKCLGNSTSLKRKTNSKL